jgi:hypothetical protein
VFFLDASAMKLNVPIIYNNQATIRDFTNLKEGRTLKFRFQKRVPQYLETRTIKATNHGLTGPLWIY